MPRCLLWNDWSLDVDAAFEREDTDDGLTIFRRNGMVVTVVVYADQPFDGEKAVRRHLRVPRRRAYDYTLPANDDGITGGAILVRDESGLCLRTVAASLGRIVPIDFCFADRGDLDIALGIWRSLRHHPPEWVRMCGRTQPPLSRLREALDMRWRTAEAAEAAHVKGQAAESAAVCVKALGSDRPSVRIAAAEVLGQLGVADSEVLSALHNALDDECVEARAWAADALLDLDEPEESVVPAMIAGLRNQEPPLPKGEDRVQGICAYMAVPDRYHAARILSQIGEAALSAREALLESRFDESGPVRIRVAEALWNIGEPIETVLPPLSEALRSSQMCQRERMDIAKELAEWGEPPEEILPAVLDALENSSDYTTQIDALETLGKLGRHGLPAADLIESKFISAEDLNLKRLAAQALMRMGVKESVARPVLLAALADAHYPNHRAEILTDLGRGAGVDAALLQRLAKELDSEHLCVRCAAAGVLAAHDVELDRSLEAFVAALGDEDDYMRWNAAVALGRLAPKASQHVGCLMRVARDDEVPEVQTAAIWALGALGNRDAAVISLLSDLAASENEAIRRQSDAALKSLQSPAQ